MYEFYYSKKNWYFSPLLTFISSLPKYTIFFYYIEIVDTNTHLVLFSVDYTLYKYARLHFIFYFNIL